MFALGSEGLFPPAFSESMEAVFATVAPIAKGDGLFVAGLHAHAHAVTNVVAFGRAFCRASRAWEGRDGGEVSFV